MAIEFILFVLIGFAAVVWGVVSIIRRAARTKLAPRPPDTTRSNETGAQPSAAPQTLRTPAKPALQVKEIVAIVGGIVSIIVGILTIIDKITG